MARFIVKISRFCAKAHAHLVFHWCLLYKNFIYRWLAFNVNVDVNVNSRDNRSNGFRAVFKWLSKVITWLRLLRLVIGLKDSRQFLNQWNAKPKPIAPCTRDFSRASSELQVIAGNCDWFIALFAPVVIGRSNCFGFGFLSHLKTALTNGEKPEYTGKRTLAEQSIKSQKKSKLKTRARRNWKRLAKLLPFLMRISAKKGEDFHRSNFRPVEFTWSGVKTLKCWINWKGTTT